MFADRPDPFEVKLPVFPGILLIIPAEEIGEMPFEYRMEGVLPRGRYRWALCAVWSSALLPYNEIA